ncbi:MAG: hypothetical protein WC546_05925 [Candidatus Omnitrophota bacterium]
MRKLSIFDLISLGLLVFVAVFSAARFNHLPQFVDGYYHLSVANGFIKSGGFTSWAWWDFAPFGRPHLYPPFYHFILVFLIKSGLSGLTALRLTEILISPLFFFFLWFVSRSLINDRFAFLNLFIASSFFAFYSSVSANVPASLAITLGLLAWFFLKKKKWLSAALFMSICFYTHAGIPWIFFISLFFLAIFNQEYRKLSLNAAIVSIVAFMPFLSHELQYINSVHLTSLYESRFISFNLLAIFCALIAMYLNRRSSGFAVVLFWGYLLISAVVFIKYPYRFFSSQGFIGIAFFSSLLLLGISNRFGNKQKLFLLLVSLYLFFVNASLNMEAGKIKFNIADSTFYNLTSRKANDNITFKAVFSEKFYRPIVKTILANTSANDIISSNIPVAAQIFSSLSGRPSSASILKEVQPQSKFRYSDYAKLIILIKPVTKKDAAVFGANKFGLIFENDIAYILLNKNYLQKGFAKKASFSFLYVSVILMCLTLIIFIDNLRKKPLCAG